jgi:iron complex transport system substrate-binding protein
MRRATRRQVLAAVPGLALLSLAAACGSDDEDSTPTATTAAAAPTTAASATPAADPTATTSAADGAWTFTDDRGVTIELSQMPERVVAYAPIAAALWDSGFHVVGVYGTTLRADGTPEITTGSMDLDAVVSLGETYGELDMEALVGLQPQLIVFDIYTPEVDLWGVPADMVAQIESIAPILGISYVERPVTDTIARIEELAGALGADLNAPEVVEARAQFDAASAAVEAAVADKPGLEVLFIAAWSEALYIANPPMWNDLIYFQDLGLQVVVPDVEPTELWETLSWEQAGKYPADLALNDARSGSLSVAEMNEIATWAAHPAAQAGQVGAWQTEFVASYAGFTAVLEDLAGTVSQANPDVM